MAEDSSSDEETVYIKKPTPKVIHTHQLLYIDIVCVYASCICLLSLKEERRHRHFKPPSPVSPCPEGSSKAEWAVNNMSFNPGITRLRHDPVVCYSPL